jgi:thiol-disulfide isomerase/thioredoxin
MAVLLSACSLQRDISTYAAPAAVGKPAPELNGVTLDGKPLRVAFAGAPSVVIFWAAWCGPCRHEQPGLDRVASEYGVRGIRFYGVDMLDHDRGLAQSFVQEFAVPYPSLYDDSGSVAAAYQVDAPPSIVLVGRQGTIAARYPGELSEGQLRQMIAEKLG